MARLPFQSLGRYLSIAQGYIKEAVFEKKK